MLHEMADSHLVYFLEDDHNDDNNMYKWVTKCKTWVRKATNCTAYVYKLSKFWNTFCQS